jgi:hypothetical protein
MNSERLRGLDDILAELFREGSPISTHVEPALTTAVDQANNDEALSKDGLIRAVDDAEDATPMANQPESVPERVMADQPESVLDGLNLDTAIRLRWALRDINAKRTKLSPLNPNDLAALIELELVEVRDGTPVLTNQGNRALDRR